MNGACKLPNNRQPAPQTTPMTTAAPATSRAATRPDDLLATALRSLGRLGFAGLVLYHVWLLGVHLLDGQAFEPATAVRWVLAVLVLVGFRALSRRGLPLLSGRRAVGLWLLVVIIHCSAAWEGGAAAALDRAIPESVTALAQLSGAALVLAAVFAAAFSATVRLSAASRAALVVPALIAGLPSTGIAFCFSPRPPPLA
jgi:hypothetical protein